ncbi:Acetyltransferase (GNAT) family protein [Rubrivivax sp. A210]|uniref:GNAT family N-acetyltransferase n=1 Tax=Rubrivivax sp. A210 TaxID=2772301 RepID=UPI0019188A93|nr:GNAT family N-acetyltransferase [Rubrivivax sp. A210]CAD5373297.1 Acetyltransferase (GNAT) family protein [Rubrivivax sp. A210]
MAAFAVYAAAPEADLARVDAGLDAFNTAQPALRAVQPLTVLARDDGGPTAGGEVIAGAVGRSWGRCCELLQLWVDARHRGHGIASALMRRFEQAAAERGCDLVYLDTFSFQAPAFYERLGYRTVLRTEGYTEGIVKHTMHKVLGR